MPVDFLPFRWHRRTVLTNVAAIVYDGLNPFEFGAACEAFGLDRRDDGVPTLDFAVCAPRPGPVQTSMGFSIDVQHDLSRVAEADLVVLPAMGFQFETRPVPPGVREALLAAYERGARILTLCSGAFILGEVGLLDGIECTTHWKYTSTLQSLYPQAQVVPEVLYVDTGQIVTSAGTAAGLDASLHIWRQEYGAAVASVIARRMVIPPQRAGGQAQFIERSVPEVRTDSFGELLDSITADLAQDHGVEALAHRALMSPRTFARRFRAETGATPHAWVTRQRVLAAEELLERTDRSVDWIAAEVGFANAATLRVHFNRLRGISPTAYRRQFACDMSDAG